MVFFWDKEDVRNDIFHEITEKSTSRIVTLGQEAVGFCWGYPTNSVDLEKKIGLPGLAKTINEQFGAVPLGYIDEVGVTPNLRLRGLGKNLWTQAEEILAERGCQVIVARSRPDVKIFNWWIRTGFQIIQKYGGDDKRVVIARAISL
ncbi:MAG: GNAT family N-acetyltransferase [Candidatus Magasanikbacteria bacterium]|nr:GNAT family N-acetyltransferase [Candidatus Magasanikbacteria bacterium]